MLPFLRVTPRGRSSIDGRGKKAPPTRDGMAKFAKGEEIIFRHGFSLL